MARKMKGRKSKRRTRRGGKSRRYSRRYLKKGGRRRVRRTRSRTRRTRRTRRKRRRRRQRGGSCPYEKNMGEYFTLRPYNNLSGGDPARALVNSNANNKVPIPYKKSGGGRRRTRVQKGGSAFQKTGLGDLGQLFYGAGNAMKNFGNTWRGKSDTIGGNPIDQPEMLKASDYRHKIPDVKRHHEGGVNEAVGKGTSA
jgi:hypothetical protein